MARLIALSLLSVALVGCNDIGPSICARDVDSNPYVDYSQGTVTNGVYETSPWNGEYLHFPGGFHYQLDHHLGVTPSWVTPYLSFDRYGDLDGGVVGPGSGNEFEITSVDDKQILVDNGSCVEFWLRVTAGTGDSSSQD